MRKVTLLRWVLGIALAGFMAYAPFLYYRYELEHAKRLRAVVDGKVYRCGCLTADGFRDALHKYKIKTLITFYDEDPDPALSANRFSHDTIRESALCAEVGVDYQFIFLDLSDSPPAAHDNPAVKRFLEIMDKPESYPVLIHCKAGLHRTGVMAAIYRMEYDGWSREDAFRELKSHGFGDFRATSANPYIQQYVLSYEPRRLRLNAQVTPR